MIRASGVGLHSGQKVYLALHPADNDTGIVFRRTDLHPVVEIEARAENVGETQLSTTLVKGDVRVSTVEHLLAALAGLGVDNARIDVSSPEIPIMDGSAIEFVDAIKSVGIKEQKDSRKFVRALKKVEVIDGKKSISIEPLSNDLIVDFEIVYSNPLIRTRRKEFKLSNDDLTNIYNSRTFCLFEDIEQIKNQGLAKGGTLDNAIVVQGNRVLNDDGLRNRHEFVYHKILDCLGDLMLSGHRIFGHIKTSQGGHALTNKLLMKFFSEQTNWTFETLKNKDETSEKSFKNTIAIGA